DRSGKFTLRMAPMIDMIFLLLIFFLVAGNWRQQEDFLPFKLPVAQAMAIPTAKPEPLEIQIESRAAGCTVTIGQFDTVFINDSDIEKSLAVLVETLNDVMIRQRRYVSDPVEITCGQNVRWEQLTKIYNLLFGMGLTDITFMMTE
ncbi:MAG: ExbD/TolR family protein, partial [Planctomycetota bacterium]